MDHGGQQAEAVPLQVGRYDVPPGQPGGPAMVQYTTVTISNDPPKDHIIWSIFNLVYGNMFCLGLAALIYSVKVILFYVQHLNSVATALISLTILSSIIAVIVISVNVNANSYYNHRRY
uniref:Uncharacterized protein n=1 Tax=Monopterus albus TaxID=43700 RepID=A0A3Q3IK14_MONAL